MAFVSNADMVRREGAIKYRKEIDGLRAISVLSVVFYHFKLGPFSGGFVGVDVFFVISGYLITSIISKEIGEDRFSFSAFYKRRALRLLPAFFAVALASLLAGFILLLPKEFVSLAWQVLYSTLGAANFYFLFASGGYFDRSTDLMPMLHMWSLAVEEQFYLIWPAILIVGHRISKKSSLSAIAILISIATLSLIAAVVVVRSNQPVAFYMLHTRAWELAIGGLLAFAPRLRSRLIAETAKGLGLLMIGYAVLYTSPKVFPGEAALLPTIGAALIIWPSSHRSTVDRLLSTPPFVAFGLISYSLYLWHWPLASFARHASLTESFDRSTALVLVLVSVTLAGLTYVFIETPFRRGSKLSAPQVLASAGAAILALSMASITVVLQSGFPSRLPPSVASLAQGMEDYSPNRAKCHRIAGLAPPISESCAFGDDSAPTVAMWADSHGIELADAIGERLKHSGTSILSLTYSACPASLSFARPDRAACIEYNDNVLKHLINQPMIKRVFIIAFYSHYENFGADKFYSGLARSVRTLAAHGKQVTILGPVPTPGFDVPARASKTRMISPERIAVPVEAYSRLNRRAIKEISSLLKIANVNYASVGANFCDQTTCFVTEGDRALYFDDNHLSMHGARIVARSLFP